jgi:tRNA-2-methylthio-N6-dimethylallyladenosine synthase
VAGKYFIETFGCQMNFHDSERVAGLLEEQGYERAPDEQVADLVVINTCSVRARAEEKLYARLADLKSAASRGAHVQTIAVTGCVAQQEGSRLSERAPHVDVVVGTQSLKHLPGLIAESRATAEPRIDIDPHEDVSFPLGVARHSDPVRAWVTIIEGCNEFCSFCVVPYTRGHERMRPVAAIVAEVAEAVRTGHIEVQLLGQIVNHYRAPDDPACDFGALLERVSAVPGLARIRFASPHPRHVTPRLVAAMRDLPKVCRHIHLPVQSGSNRVLRAMRRRYTRDQYLDGIERLRASIPGLEVSTDIIVGFPGETAEDFDETLDLVRAVRYLSLYSFKYSARPRTLASTRMTDDVPEAEKTRRIMALQEMQRDIQIERYRDYVGSIREVLVDTASRRGPFEVGGRTSENVVVSLPGPADWVGRLMDVRVTDSTPYGLRGEAVRVPAVSG